MIMFRICLLILLTAGGLGCNNYNYRPQKVALPYKTNYATGDYLNIVINLNNIPAFVTDYVVYYQTGNCSQENSSFESPLDTTCNEILGTGQIVSGQLKKKISLNKKLSPSKLKIFVELRKQKKICSSKMIMSGERRTTIKSDENVCFISTRPCEMEVDFKHECDGRYFDKGKLLSFKCTPQLKHVTDWSATEIEWHHVDKNNSTMGTIPRALSLNTNYIIRMESFDDNTYAFCSFNATPNHLSKSSLSKIYLSENSFDEDENVTIIRYSDKKDVQFDCQEYLKFTNYTHAVSMDIKNKFTTYNTTKVKKKFKMADNGTIFCCFYYVIYVNNGEKAIIRYVKRKTMLIYDESMAFSFEDNDIDYTIVYIVSSVIALVILILVIYIMAKKYCCKKPNSGVSLELNTYSRPSGVLYADLNIPTSNNQLKPETDEPAYSEIIGVLQPK